MYNTITKTITFRNYTGSTKDVLKEILNDIFFEILKKYSKDLFEEGTSIVEENIREQILHYFHRCTINNEEFFNVFQVRSEYPCSDVVGHIDIRIKEIKTKKEYGIELKCPAEFSSSGKGKRSAQNMTALAVHQDISRLERKYPKSGFFIFITDDKYFYTETARARNPFLINLRNSKINKGIHINEGRKKTGEATRVEVWIKNNYNIDWKGSEKTKGFILEI